MTKSLPRLLTTPSIGSNVVNGYSATFGFAAEHRPSSVDFPALGLAINPTSARQLQLQEENYPLSLLSLLSKYWFLIDRGYEPAVAPSAGSTSGYQPWSSINHVGDERFLAMAIQRIDRSAQGDFDDGIIAVTAPLVFALSVGAAIDVDRAVKLQMQQRIEPRIAADIGASSGAAITPVWPSHWPVFFTEEADAAISAVTTFDI